MPVNCNRCGSAVAVGPDTRHVTCSRCRTPLVVVRTASSVFTDIAARQKELERVDREWEEEKERGHMWTDRNGRRRTWDEQLEPAIIIAVIFGLVLLVATVFAIKEKRLDAVVYIVLLGALPAALLAVTGVKARRYWRAEARYRERRSAAEQRPWHDATG